MGCRRSSVDSFAPSILPPRVRIISKPSTLFKRIKNIEKNKKRCNGQVTRYVSLMDTDKWQLALHDVVNRCQGEIISLTFHCPSCEDRDKTFVFFSRFLCTGSSQILRELLRRVWPKGFFWIKLAAQNLKNNVSPSRSIKTRVNNTEKC